MYTCRKTNVYANSRLAMNKPRGEFIFLVMLSWSPYWVSEEQLFPDFLEELKMTALCNVCARAEAGKSLEVSRNRLGKLV